MGERQRIRACGVVTEDGDFFHAQLAGGKAWDEAWLYKDDHYSNTDEDWGHPWDNFWASTRAPRRWRAWTRRRRPRRPTRARGTWRASSTAGPTCAIVTSSATTSSSSKLKAAVKKWPDKGGSDAIPDACALVAGGAHRQPHEALIRTSDPTCKLDHGRKLAASVGLIYVVGVAAACCVRSRRS